MFWQKRLIAEFEKQSFTQIIFPHQKSDWKPYLQEAQECFVNIINAITKYQKCLVVCDNTQSFKSRFKENENLYFVEYQTDDTWARDCSALSVAYQDTIQLLDFTFNGWGGKFDAHKDNALTQSLAKCYNGEIIRHDFVLEGGGIESNGAGTILTTSACLWNKNRNPDYSKDAITRSLKAFFGAEEILYLHHGYLAGDDTDSHIDTLARFIDEKTIMYVECSDADDEHYRELLAMKEELQNIAKKKGYTLIPLPMCSAVYYKGERLPATYANFLFVNGAVLIPTYNIPEDTQALEIFHKSFPEREIVAVDCSTLIRQHGSLHCVTMNFPEGVLLNTGKCFG